MSARSEAGQATVELTALLPLLALVATCAFSVLAAQTAGEQAGIAAEAGAVALLQDRDPREAARRALSGRARATIEVDGSRVTVTVRPRVPLLARLLKQTTTADAGAGVGTTAGAGPGVGTTAGAGPGVATTAGAGPGVATTAGAGHGAAR